MRLVNVITQLHTSQVVPESEWGHSKSAGSECPKHSWDSTSSQIGPCTRCVNNVSSAAFCSMQAWINHMSIARCLQEPINIIPVRLLSHLPMIHTSFSSLFHLVDQAWFTWRSKGLCVFPWEQNQLGESESNEGPGTMTQKINPHFVNARILYGHWFVS